MRIRAELQTPGTEGGIALSFDPYTESGTDSGTEGQEQQQQAAEEKEQEQEKEKEQDGKASSSKRILLPGATQQRIVRHLLTEEGTHVLAVTVTYNETVTAAAPAGQGNSGPGPAASGRVRTFRKLYQFVAQQVVGVRTKIGEMEVRAKGQGKKTRRFAIEAQLENLGDAAVVLEAVDVVLARGLRSQSLNFWDRQEAGEGKGERGGEGTGPVLAPQDVMQVAFVLEKVEGAELEEKGDRVVLAQLVAKWRGPMGEMGSLTTGWLGSRGR